MAARTPSIHIFLGRPLFLLFPGIHSIINFGSLSSCIILTWPYHWSLFLSVMSGFSFTPIISFICSFFILSILDFLADLLSTSISVDKRAARLLRSWVRIPPGAWIFVCCECRVLSGRGLCDELITLQRSPTDCAASLCVI